MKTLVLFGHDPQLLHFRRLILEREHFRVITIDQANELDLVTEPVDLLIICQTIKGRDCEEVLGIASTRWPGVHALVLVAGQSGTTCAPNEERFFTFDGPAQFIARVYRLVQSQAVA